MIANSKVLVDNQLRLTSNTTIQGAAQAKGTATALQLVIMTGKDGVSAVGGTTTYSLQGSNTTDFASSNTITPDKGTLANATAAGFQVVDVQNLQYAYYRVNVSAAASTTSDSSAVWNFQNLQDSFDNTVQ